MPALSHRADAREAKTARLGFDDLGIDEALSMIRASGHAAPSDLAGARLLRARLDPEWRSPAPSQVYLPRHVKVRFDAQARRREATGEDALATACEEFAIVRTAAALYGPPDRVPAWPADARALTAFVADAHAVVVTGSPGPPTAAVREVLELAAGPDADAAAVIAGDLGAAYSWFGACTAVACCWRDPGTRAYDLALSDLQCLGPGGNTDSLADAVDRARAR